MKNIIPILALAAAFTVSCQNNTTTATMDSSKTTSVDSTVSQSQCFAYIKNRDTVLLTLHSGENKVSGDLIYTLFEKDKNTGTISGIVKTDTIIADYEFESEGMRSVREIVWLKKGDKLIEGFGEVTETDGKTKFKNISKLTFGNSMVLSKINCK